MSSIDRRVVIDASGIVAWLLREPGSLTIDKLLSLAVVPASAMTESLYRARERGSQLSIEDLYDSVVALGVEVEPIEAEDAMRAAELIETSRRSRAKPDDRSLSLGDGLCIAVAERLGLVVTGGDLHWETLSLRVAFEPFR